MASEFGTVALALTGVGINTVYAIEHKRDPFPIMFAGALFTGVCVVISAGDARLGTTLAGLFLLATFLTRGNTFINWTNNLVKGSGA